MNKGENGDGRNSALASENDYSDEEGEGDKLLFKRKFEPENMHSDQLIPFKYPQSMRVTSLID